MSAGSLGATGTGVRTRVGSAARAARQGWHKLRWGTRTVGAAATASGGVRLLRLRTGPPRWTELTLRSGTIMGFQVPTQVPTALVVFGDLIDPEFRFLAEVADPGWTVVDVGAAIGQFTVHAARLPAARVHAFEPSSANRASLARNLEGNGVADRVSVHATALSEHAGEASFETAANTYLSRLDRHAGPAGTRETVSVQPLSAEAERLGLADVSVLKVNVAGYEPEVLAGAAPLLATGSVGILVLLISTRSVPWFARCEGWGYEFFFYHPRERALHRVDAGDEAALASPPWPARHVIGIHRSVPRTGGWAQITYR